MGGTCGPNPCIKTISACPVTCTSNNTLTYNGNSVPDVIKTFSELPFTLDLKSFITNPESMIIGWGKLTKYDGVSSYEPTEELVAYKGLDLDSNNPGKAEDTSLVVIKPPTDGQDLASTGFHIEYTSFSCSNELSVGIIEATTSSAVDEGRFVKTYIPFNLKLYGCSSQTVVEASPGEVSLKIKKS